MKAKATRRTVFTVSTSISLASKWRASKRGASSFAETYPEAYKKIAYASTRRGALTTSDAKEVANWLVNHA